jgi:protein MpaA
VIGAAAALLAASSMVLGHSVEDRPLVAKRLGEAGADRTVLVVGSIHGNETQGERIVSRLRDRAGRLGGVALWTIETVNPDGVAAGTRGNANAVDLNRNFAEGWREIPPSSGYYSGPRPFSEPETRAVRRFLRRIRPDVTVWYHQPFGNTLIPCERRGRRVALRYARLSGLPPDDCYPTPPGAATGWQDAALKAKAFVAELGPGRLSRAEVRRHARAVLRIARR